MRPWQKVTPAAQVTVRWRAAASSIGLALEPAALVIEPAQGAVMSASNPPVRFKVR